MKKLIINVNGMSCEGCENRIKNAVQSIDGVESVLASHKDSLVAVMAEDSVDENIIKERIEDIGFEVV